MSRSSMNMFGPIGNFFTGRQKADKAASRAANKGIFENHGAGAHLRKTVDAVTPRGRSDAFVGSLHAKPNPKEQPLASVDFLTAFKAAPRVGANPFTGLFAANDDRSIPGDLAA